MTADDPAISDADLPPDATVCVVAVQSDTFEACHSGGYPCPRSYARTRRDFDYMALYRTAPVSAITHVGAVTGRTVERRDDAGGWMTAERWETLIDPFGDTDEVVVFELGSLVGLSEPIQNDTTGVRGAWYCTVADLLASDRLSELSARATDD